MLKSGKRANVIVCGMMALFSSASFAAGTTNVTDGMTFEMTSIPGTNAQRDFNVYASFIDCSGTCTVKILNDGGVDVRPLFRLAENTQLTLDLTARSGEGPILAGGIVAEVGASVIVKGDLGTFRLGRGGTGTTSFAVLDADNISFVNSAGEPIDGTIRFTSSSMLIRVPPPEKVNFACQSTPRIYAYGADVLHGRYIDGNGDVVFSGFNLIDAGHGAIPAGATVRVGANSTFSILHCDVSSTYGSFSFVADWTFTNNVELTDSSSVFAIIGRNGGDFTGTLSGTGSVRMFSYADYAYQWENKNRVTFANPFTTTGALKLESSGARLQLMSGTSVGDFSCTGTAQLRLPGEMSFTVTGTATDGNIRVDAGGSLSLAAASGTITVSGDTRYTSSMNLAALAEGGRVKYRSTVAASSSVTGVRKIETGDGGLYFLGGYDLAGIDTGITGVKTLLLSGSDNEISSLAADYEIELADASSSARVVADATNAPSIRLNGGAVTLGASDIVSNILNRALIWCDASNDDAWTPHPNNTWTVQCGDLAGNVYQSVGSWNDVRGTTTYSFKPNSAVDYTCPYRVTNEWNGTYVSFDTRKSNGAAQTCRFLLYKNGSANSVSAKLVIMVFDSSLGGGAAVLGNEGGAFKRAGTTISVPILPAARTDCAVWLDGEAQADPTNCYFSGSWQIISIDPGSSTISGLARPESNNVAAKGGQNIAEILIFNEELTDTERMRVERYLAEKWGLSSQYKGGTYSNPVEARVYGAGNIALDTDATLGGIYTGTVALAGHTLNLPVCAAPTDDEVAAIADRTGWFDPSDRRSIDFYDSAYSDWLVKHLNDRTLGKSDGAWMIYANTIARGPYWRDGGWLDLRAGSSGAVGKVYPEGSLIRFNQWSNNVDTTTISPMPVRTVIMAMDSSGGGGTPLGTKVDVTQSDLGQRIAASDATAKFTKSDYASPIWPSAAKSEYKSAAVYLDGVAVDATARGFNGRKEVFSSVFGTDLALGVFSDYQRNTYTNALGAVQGEILGEMLMFSRELEDSERNLVEAYLMRKWCGTTLPGYGDFTGATVTGAGTVNVPCVAAAPKFDPGFTGTVAFTNETLSFTIDATVSSDAAVNAVVAANGTVSLPAAVTIEVEIVPPAVVDSYTLLSASALSAPLDLTLSVDAGSSGKKAYALRRTASAIILDVLPKGMIVTVR